MNDQFKERFRVKLETYLKYLYSETSSTEQMNL